MKAFLGMGLLGSNFVRAMLKKGEQVNVWNRTTSKAKALEADGAHAFEDVKSAVKDADVIHLTVKDDASVNEVLAAAEAALKPGATVIDHTTTSVEGAVQRTRTWKEKGFTYLHAPVFMGPKNALESTGFMLVSGDQQVISKWQDQLSSMTGKLLNFGPTEGKAAGMKLIGNLFLISLTAGLSDVLKLAKSVDINGDEINNLFTQWNPGAMVQQRLKTILAADFSHPSWELNMARKDAGLMMKEAENANEELTVIPAVTTLMDEWIKNGHGNDDWMIIAS